jgi:hypothetical protein
MLKPTCRLQFNFLFILIIVFNFLLVFWASPCYYVIIEDFYKNALLLVTGPPSALPSKNLFTYFLLAGGMGLVGCFCFFPFAAFLFAFSYPCFEGNVLIIVYFSVYLGVPDVFFQ